MRIGSSSSILKCFRCLHLILKNITQLPNYVTNQCGFEAFTYLFFLRRMAHLLTILLLTDLTVWLPYLLFFQKIEDFSLVVMPSNGNNIFRTFYSLWVALVVLYGLGDMKGM